MTYMGLYTCYIRGDSSDNEGSPVIVNERASGLLQGLYLPGSGLGVMMVGGCLVTWMRACSHVGGHRVMYPEGPLVMPAYLPNNAFMPSSACLHYDCVVLSHTFYNATKTGFTRQHQDDIPSNCPLVRHQPIASVASDSDNWPVHICHWIVAGSQWH
ncbi:hypothetical protein NP493_142g01002 [Ridgeia piscesae]|uniref:Uncharacterized protein n=1 Tax=Ridgeia piscesae TaxID=27915 RepID=A0AAD9UG65_RIDPI|nr:hypothetical protein NP493_142g01002 [Ridgeia piscesae]